MQPQKLLLLDRIEYAGVNRDDPLRFYFAPVVGRLYRRRLELCLHECRGGERVLEVGFGSGITFLNLAKQYREIHGLDATADIQKVAAVFMRRGAAPILRNGSVMSLPYDNDYFDTVLLISILEHLRPASLTAALQEVRRVLRPQGQMVYGVPVDNCFMRFCFLLLGYDIRKHHFSSERHVAEVATRLFKKVSLTALKSAIPFAGNIYEIGHFVK
ncbi:MAG: class I SAM-dependent methyltransferase [Chitinivibrionales bacterium]|nr:class I SAM-dependent methyltransferase [Chitinivibrionales bacterium]